MPDTSRYCEICTVEYQDFRECGCCFECDSEDCVCNWCNRCDSYEDDCCCCNTCLCYPCECCEECGYHECECGVEEDEVCISIGCRERGEKNVNIKWAGCNFTTTMPLSDKEVFLCRIHIKYNLITIKGYKCCKFKKVRKEEAHQCGLILCSICLDSVEELLSF